LINRFILGSGNKAIGTTGGLEAVTLNEGQMPQHTHGATVSDPGHEHRLDQVTGNGGGVWWGYDNSGRGGRPYPSTNNAKTGVTVSINHTDGNQSHENMPPFYVLTYIMKL
jgi:microcystin-dependent protein